MTIFGWDMSHYDSVPAGGGAKVAAEGFSFCTHKAGGDANDAELGAWWSAFRSFRDRLLLGAYWVLYPGNPAGRADAFLARLDDKCPGWRDGPFILQLDCEIWNGDSSTKPGRADIKAACDRLRAKMPKLRPIVYASAGQYGDSLTGLGYPLWNARYPLSDTAGTASGLYVRCGGDSGKGWASYSGQVPAIWQYTSSAVIAGQSTCDANAYRGSLAELTALVAPGWTEKRIIVNADDVQAVRAAVQAELGEFFAVGKNDDGSPTSVIGRNALDQGIPSPWSPGKRDNAYRVIGQTAATVKALAEKLDVPLSEVLAAVGDVDEQVLAALADAGHSDDELAAALRAALGDRAAAVGRLLAGQ